MSRKLAWTEVAWDDYICWQGQDEKMLKRINKLIEGEMREPFEGIRKPEPLRENLAGLWS
jgi:toxin YoeB